MISEITDDQRRDYLKDEYLCLQAHYEDYDRRPLILKSWATGGATAALALTFNTSYKLALFVPVLVATVCAVIWYLEAHWKLFQYALADRIRVIEAYFRNDPDILLKTPHPLQIYHWWYLSYAKDEPIYEYERTTDKKPGRPQPLSARLRRVAFQRYVCLPYLPILGLCAAAVLLILSTPRP
jgi:hypothetical protein